MENKIDKYWLNLDPNTFIFEGCSEFVLYNADFKTIVKIAKTETINRLMYGFLNVNNLYTLLVSDNDLDNPEINNFISILRQNFMGDVFYTAVTKPITIPPVMKCHSTLRGDIKNENLLSMLNELTFYINGSCDKECLHCSEYCKQFLSCHKNSGYLRFTDIKNIIINVTRIVPSLKINICGGNLSDYSDINDLVLFFRIKNINAHFYINYTNLTCDFVEKINSKNITLHVLVNFPVSNNILFDKIAFLGKVRCNIVYNFILTSDEDIVTLDKLSNCYSINNYQVIPFYTGNNLSFFHNSGRFL